MTLARLSALLSGTGYEMGINPTLLESGGPTVAELATSPYELLDEQVNAVAARYGAPRHVAASLWWKAYAYWVTLPIGLGWALDRTFPAFTPERTVVRLLDREPHLSIGLSELETATDVRATLIALHTPLIDALHELTRIGRRNLWGSVAESLIDPLEGFAAELDGNADARTLLDLAGPPVKNLMACDPVKRRTCCLWVALPDEEACSSCVLR
ncbi:hypothetical protein GCM10027589_23070 [Actinocorallia lasiicapitis]